MKKLLAFTCLCCTVAIALGQPGKKIAIIPEPVSLTQTAGTFTLPKTVVITGTAQTGVSAVSDYLKKKLTTAARVTFSEKASAPAYTVKFLLNKSPESKIGKEGYHLTVSPKNILITANEPAGLFYGVQTLLQLFPKDIESHSVVNKTWTVPCVNITDYPRFEWRGLMFDVSRHFFTKQDVKDFIDQMVRYKFNLLHMHLTDDEGWRIEIKSLPRLTQVGAWRADKVGYFGDFTPPAANEPKTYGGFYTQDDIRELVRYAKENYVNILPEIDVPGHSLAAVSAYPELSCTPGADKYTVRSGEMIADWSKPGGPVALVDNTLCPANEKVYDFLDKVLTEVAQLFPFPYIHMGGDECMKNFWEKSDAVKALMQRENLKNYEEVQSYFEKRVEKIVESKGKKFMGWDEILEGGLAPDAAVMSWRGMKGGIAAAKAKHDVIMSPTTYAYLDYMQGDVAIEPKVYATLRLSKAYSFEPVPDSVDASFIKGGQANLWTEQVYNMRHLEYMIWPRAFAISETLWSPKEKKNWNDFASRVETQFDRYNVADIKYAPSIYDPIFTTSLSKDNLISVNMSTEINGLDIYYSWDNSFPDNHYAKYTQPLVIPTDAAQLKVITYRGNQPIGRMITIQVADLNKRAGKK